MKGTLLILLTLSILFPAEYARAGGEEYSLYGVGDLSLLPSGRSMGLGSMSAALWSTSSLLPRNPASWGSMKTAELQGTLNYENISTSSATDQSFFGGSNMQGATLGFPILPQEGMTLGVGFIPFSTVRYAFNSDVQTVSAADSVSSQSSYTGTGGISTFFLGTSFSPVSWLSLGAALEYNFGAITRSVDVLFNSASQYNHTLVTRNISPDGFDSRIAAMVTTGALTVGTTVRLPATWRMVSKQTYSATTFGAVDTTVASEYKQDIPLSLSAGASFGIAEFRFGVEYGMEDWNSANTAGVHPPELRSSSTIGFGVERTGTKTATGLDRWDLRLGGLYRASYISANGTSISEAYVTVGAGIPVNAQTAIDIGIQYGSRGTTANGLVRENVFRLTTTFSINEPWFQTREER